MTIIILNHATRSVDVVKPSAIVAENIRKGRIDAENYLQYLLNYKPSQISFMAVDEHQVPVYYQDDSTMPTLCSRESADEPAVLL